MLREIPTPKNMTALQGLRNLTLRNPLPLLLRFLRDDGDLLRLPATPLTYLLAQHPDHLRHVLQENAANYRKSFNYEALRMVVGNGLLASEGDFWKRQRRLLQPAFHRGALARLTETMARCTQDLADRWAKLPAGTVVDVAEEIAGLTLRIAGKTLFSVEVQEDAPGFARAVTDAQQFISDRSRSFIRLPKYVPLPSHLRLQRALRVLDSLVYKIIESRRRDPGSARDLLALLMEARDADTGEAMSDEQLRDEVLTFLSAGHETTANALTWALYLLSQHPGERRRVQAEVAQVLAGRPPALEDLPKLELTRAVIDETLRLYPPAWFIERQANAEDELGGYRIPKNAVVGICTYTLHRDPRFFDNPEGFDPDRFSPARAGARPKFAYLPFGGGPRTCIGAQFALWEAQIALAHLVQRFVLDLVPGHPVELEPLVTLRSRYGMKMALRAA